VLPSIFILEEGVVMAITIRSWLITVYLSLPEEISVVVASFAALHLLSDAFSSLDWIRKSKNCSISAFFVVGNKSIPLMSGLVLLHVASHVIPSQLMIIDKGLSDGIWSCDI